MDNINYRLDWNSRRNGTYRTGEFDEKRNEICKPIPNHPQIKNIYDDVYDYVYEEYWYTNCKLETCLQKIEEKYGKLTQDIIDYIIQCPWKAGSRAAYLKEDPNFYD